MDRRFQLSVGIAAVALGAIVCAGACFGSLPPGGHAAGAGAGGEGSGGTGGNPPKSDAGSDAGCALPDGGVCVGLDQVCSVYLANGGCYQNLVCALNGTGEVYVCQPGIGDGGCDAGPCAGLDETCSEADPNNGGCEEGLYCAGVIEPTGTVYSCQPPPDAGG